MSIATYGELKTAIAAWAHRDDLTAYLPDFVTMAEAKIFSDLKVVEMEARTSYTPSSRYLATPTRLTSIRRIVALAATPTEIQSTSPDGLRVMYENASGTPSHYAVLGSEIEFNRIPNINIEILHYAAPAPLSDSAPANAVLTAYPHVYLAACMVEAGDYMMDDSLVAKWQGKYADALSAANRKSSKFHTGGPMAVITA